KAKPPTAGPVRVLRELDVTDDRVELPVAEIPLRELRHHVRPDPYRLGDLKRRRVDERGRERARDDSALRDDLVTTGAVLREQLQTLRDVPDLRLRPRDRRPAEARDVGDERADLVVAQEDRLPATLH